MILVTMDVLCETAGCGNCVQVGLERGHSPEIHTTQGRQAALALGWGTVRSPRGTIDLCPECAARRNPPVVGRAS